MGDRSLFDAGLTDEKVIRAEDAAVRKAKARYEVGDREAKTDVWKDAEGTNVREKWCDKFERDREAAIDDWCVYFVRMFAERSKLFVPRDLQAHEVPTARADAAYHVTRLWLVGLEAKGKGRIDGNDLYDNAHFADAAYSDVLVTDDKGFHRIAAETGNSGVRLERFEQWAESLLRARLPKHARY